MSRYVATWRGKELSFGVKTLRELVERLRAEANHLERMADAGVEIPFDEDGFYDDYIDLVTTNARTAKTFKMRKES